jgi:PAS/PAC sensor signal transduction histidine kinase (EC 2.7.13.3)
VLLRHQAELLVHSTPGKGSRFVVRFPAAGWRPQARPLRETAQKFRPKTAGSKPPETPL